MMNFELKVDGLEDMTRKIQNLKPGIRRRLRFAQIRSSERIVKAAKAYCPEDTHALKNSIRSQWSPHNQWVREVVADIRYAVFVEYGRHKYGQRDAQPFLRPAMLEEGRLYYAEAEKAVKDAIENVSAGNAPEATGGNSGSSGGSGLSSSAGGKSNGQSQSGKSGSSSNSGGSGGGSDSGGGGSSGILARIGKKIKSFASSILNAIAKKLRRK